MVISEVCGWMVTVNRDPQMQCLYVFFFILKASSNKRDPNTASSVGLVLD